MDIGQVPRASTIATSAGETMTSEFPQTRATDLADEAPECEPDATAQPHLFRRQNSGPGMADAEYRLGPVCGNHEFP